MIRTWITGQKARKLKKEYDPEELFDELYTPVKVKQKRGTLQKDFEPFLKDKESLDKYLKAFGLEEYPSKDIVI